jgi:hypothetical protein
MKILNVSKTILWTLFLGARFFGQEPEDSELRESFDNHLNIYVINAKKPAKGYEDFKNFVLAKLPGQDVQHPGTDTLGRSPVGGEVTLSDGTELPITRGVLVLNANRKYEWLKFETAEVNGKKFTFDGHFLRKLVDYPPSFTYLRGKLTVYKGRKKIRSMDLPFTIYADL